MTILYSKTPRTAYVFGNDTKTLSDLEALLESYEITAKSYHEPCQLLAVPPPTHPSCLILDHQLGKKGVQCIEVHRKLVESGWISPTLYLSSCSEVRTVVSAMRNGADNYLIKPYDPNELMAAVLNAFKRSEAMICEKKRVDRAKKLVGSLTARELEIVKLVISGHLNKEIASKLNLALVTVKVHRGHAMHKLCAGNAAELARITSLAGITP